MCNIVICGKMSRPSLSAPAGGGGAAASSDMWTAAAAARRHRSTGDWICHLQSSSSCRQSCEWRRDVNLQLCNSLIILVDRHTRRHVMWYTHCFDNAGYLVTEWMVWFEWCTIFMKSRSTLEWHIGVIQDTRSTILSLTQDEIRQNIDSILLLCSIHSQRQKPGKY